MPKAIQMTHPDFPERKYFFILPKTQQEGLRFSQSLDDAYLLNDDVNDLKFITLVKNMMDNDDLRQLTIRVVKVLDEPGGLKLARGE